MARSSTLTGEGNGPISALVHALESKGWANFSLKDYRSHALTAGSESSAAAYVSLQSKDGRTVWGCGVDANIELAGLKALVTANRSGKPQPRARGQGDTDEGARRGPEAQLTRGRGEAS
jgi:2-isopropylmalate synthase